MKIFRSKNGEWKIKQAYMENVRLKKGGTLSLYWAENCTSFKAILIRRCAGRVFARFFSQWNEATSTFHKEIAKNGKRSKDQRDLHLLSLRIHPNDIGYRCIALCKTARTHVDVEHTERIGALALAFKKINKECGCRHRKQYDQLDHFSYLR